ncbi:SulP family inorganic anion transporter [uncultured Sanguibacteroides sp.]|uniref:SulP family inorganic anion transporter n=1 Tax=uncultured Sanguibacteroides sp. TaxID=1635151 RepID=UPI0025EA6C77|nr:SulP family inorganic anion transporter [uncultured Sanguibacteroides sp.]
MEKVFDPKLFGLIKDGSVKKNLSKDILAGIVVGIVALPLAIAFAVASGVSPEKGVMTAIIAGFIISFLGGSRVQIGGPTGAFIVIVYGIVNDYGIDGMIIATMLAGIIMIGFGMLRLGTLLKFIPHPLIVGFTSGIAVVIFSTQISNALGLTIADVPSGFIGKWACYINHIHTINWYAVIITVVTVLIAVYMPKLTTKIPGSFVAILLVTPVVAVFSLPVTTIGTLYGEISCNLAPTIPSFDFGNLARYVQPAFTIAILGAIESLLSAVVADGMIGGHHRSNTELIAQGAANIVAPLFGGIPATGAIARTATNVKNGGRTPVAGMVHAVVLLLIMLFFGKWASLIPMSCLAGILIVVSYNMSEWRSFRSVLRASYFDIVILLVTFFLTVLVDLTVAIEIGVVLAALLFMKRMADNAPKDITGTGNMDQDVLENYKDIPSAVGIYEISGPFFFGSAKTYCETIRMMGVRYQVLIIRMRHVPFVDTTALKNLTETISQLTKEGTRIILSGVNDQVRKDLLKNGIGRQIGEEQIYSKFDLALKAALDRVETK